MNNHSRANNQWVDRIRGMSYRQRLLAVTGAAAVVVAGAILFASGPGKPVAPPMPPVVFEGPIMEITDVHIRVMHGTEVVAVRINGRTEITLDGKPAAVRDLKSGYWSRLTAYVPEKSPDRSPVAIKVEAHHTHIAGKP